MSCFDYEGDLEKYQRQLNDAGIDFDITNLAGCTEREIKGTVNALLNAKKREKEMAVLA